MDAAGLTVDGLQSETGSEPAFPTVTLVFRNGTQETVLDGETWHAGSPRSDHDAAISNFTGQHDGTAHVDLIFGQPLDPADLAAVIVDGQTFCFGE